MAISAATIGINNKNINIINPHYPINGRMCTLEDLFVEYNQLNLLNNTYRLLEPDKDLCPSVLDIYDDNVKVYYIEEDIYQELLKEDASIYFYNYTNPLSILVNVRDVKKDKKADPSIVDEGIYTRLTTPNGKIYGDRSTNDNTYRETIAEVYRQFTAVGKPSQVSPKYANYWAIYMRDDLFTSYIRNRMITYFGTNEVTENDSKDILFNILATKIRELQKEIGKDVFLKEVSQFASIWSQVATIIVNFFEDVFLNLQYKNEFVFWSDNTKSTGIKALNILKEYWKKIDPNYNPDQSKCRFSFSVAQDVNGYYIRTTSPIQIKKYLCRLIKDINPDGSSRTYLKYINMDDIEDIASQLLHWIQKNFIYLPYHIPNIGVNTNGSQQLYINWKNGEFTTYDSSTYKNYKENESKCLVRMCDVQSGFFVFNNADNDYITDNNEDGSISTRMSNTAFRYNLINVSYINNYALSPTNFIELNAEYKERYYAYLCVIDIGDNDKDVLEIKPAKNVSYSILKTFYDKKVNNSTVPAPIYNIAFMPNKTNTTSNIITYTSTITQKLSGITETVTFKQYPTLFLVFPELNKLSSKYHYEVERFTITSPVVNNRLLNANNYTFTDNDVLVVYKHILYKLSEINENDNDGKTSLKLKLVYLPPEVSDSLNVIVYKENWQNIKRINQTSSNTYYLMMNMTDTQDLTKEITMEITISVYDNTSYNIWKQKGYWEDDKGRKHLKLLPMNTYDVLKEDSCNVIINFYEIDNYTDDDQELVNKNKNSLHKYVGGRTDMEADTLFNTMKFSNTSTVTKNIQTQFSTGYTSWINGKKIRLKLMQHIDNDQDIIY